MKDQERTASIAVGPFIVHATPQGLVLDAAEQHYILDSEHSLELLQFLDTHRPAAEPRVTSTHAMPHWVYAMQHITR